tara:strand:+ start:16169 stop:16654 length:486 start_codon:yes stop_codon:yes gene_type:complete
MKTLIVGLFFLSLTNLITAQNKDYLNSVNAQNNAGQIEQLQKQAAIFNISELESFEKNIETTYKVTFENPNGKLVATYNNLGVILQTVEEYRNVKSTKQIIANILKSHPNWIVEGNVFKIAYSSLREPKKTLEVRLKKEKKTVTVFFNLSCKTGEILYAKN